MIAPRPQPADAPSGTPALISVAGPTASGKTALAIALARRLDTEIVSADSMQFYRGMEIGTAAPTPEELEAAPHHFVSFLQPDETMAAGHYERLARSVVRRLNESGRTAVAVGGSGLYLSALIDGLFEGPARDPEIRARLREEARTHGNAHLMAQLRAVDPEYAESLTSENDQVRLVRALEVHEITGEPFSKLHREHRARTAPLPAVHVGLDWDREALYERIDTRVDRMIEAGWVEEVRRLIDAGYGPHIERLKALGYREIAAHLRGEQTLEEAITATKMHHRRYAKRQLTWFRGDPRIHWIPAAAGVDAEQLASNVISLRLLPCPPRLRRN